MYKVDLWELLIFQLANLLQYSDHIFSLTQFFCQHQWGSLKLFSVVLAYLIRARILSNRSNKT